MHANQASPPWKKAFAECRTAERWEPATKVACHVVANPVICRVTDGAAVKACAVAMANAHINTDIAASLKTVGCIDPNDYGNMLLFVEIGARDAISKLHGRLEGPMFSYLKETFLPLDKMWRNAVYEQTCRQPVPDVEGTFRATILRNAKAMQNVREGVH